MNPQLIETEEGEAVGIYVDGFVNKQILIGFFNPRTVDVRYQWYKVEEDNKEVSYAILSDKEEAGSFGVTAIYW
jgi:hypothetical protein